jgi:integrase
VCDLQRHQVELATGRLHVRRSKRGTPAVHPLQGDELRALRRLQREQPLGPRVFVSERGAPMAPKSFHTWSNVSANGPAIEMLAGLVQAGLTTVATETRTMRPRVTIEIERIRITDAGKRAPEG